MLPNFQDRSCTILLMEPPVPPAADPLFKQPCGADSCDKTFRMPAGSSRNTRKASVTAVRSHDLHRPNTFGVPIPLFAMGPHAL